MEISLGAVVLGSCGNYLRYVKQDSFFQKYLLSEFECSGGASMYDAENMNFISTS